MRLESSSQLLYWRPRIWVNLWQNTAYNGWAYHPSSNVAYKMILTLPFPGAGFNNEVDLGMDTKNETLFLP